MELLEVLKQVNIRRLAYIMQIPPTTIYAWRDKQKIPSWRINDLKKALKMIKKYEGN